MNTTYFQWALTRAIRLFIRVFLFGPVVILTALPAGLFFLVERLNFKLSDWWID